MLYKNNNPSRNIQFSVCAPLTVQHPPLVHHRMRITCKPFQCFRPCKSVMFFLKPDTYNGISGEYFS
jgi:hypothetical protein